MNAPTPNPADALETLRWQIEAGVDLALESAPIDRFAESRAAVAPAPDIVRSADSGQSLAGKMPAARPPDAGKAKPPIPSAPSILAKAVPPDGEAVANARQMAQAARSLQELRDSMASFTGCNLRLTATNTVFSDGNPQSRVVLIGEAPGREEDLQGLPFVGRSGQLLDRMLAAIGLDRQKVYITNVLAWRPPGNRTPTPLETEICRPFLLRHIELANPHTIMLLGGAAAKALIDSPEGIMRLRGRWREFALASVQARMIATLHPAYLLRQPAAKKLAWQDFLKLRQRLDQIGG